MEFLGKRIGWGIKEFFPSFMTCLNFYRNVKGRIDLMIFLFTWDPDYRKDLIITFIVFGLLGYSITTWNDFYDIIALTLEASILIVQLGGDLSILPADYKPSHGRMIYTAATSGHVLYGEESIPMSHIRPNLAEAKLGFCNPVEGIKTCKESPLVSNKVDDALMIRDTIPYKEDKSVTNYISSRHQLRYIAIRIANKLQHTTNGKLLGLYDIANTFLSPDDPITVRKAFYFDYLLTMEAFRSRIFRGNLNGEKEVYTDLTTYFPIKKDVIDGEEVFRFKSDFYRQVPNLIGITSLLLTENNRVAMLFQGTNKVMGGGAVCLGGSGSLDYEDMYKAGRPNDFREIVRYGLAREACEETGMLKHFEEVRKNTIVTGFFRWIDRCGLPEFIGITRAGNVSFSKHKSIDGDEVTRYEEVPIDIKKPEDFIKVMHYLHEHNIHIVLSSLMALHRMVVIAGYGQDADASEDQKKIYNQIADFILGK